MLLVFAPVQDLRVSFFFSLTFSWGGGEGAWDGRKREESTGQLTKVNKLHMHRVPAGNAVSNHVTGRRPALEAA